MKQRSEETKEFRLGDDEAKHMNISIFLNRGEIKIYYIQLQSMSQPLF